MKKKMLSVEIYPYKCTCTTSIVLFLKYLGDDSEKTPTLKGLDLEKYFSQFENRKHIVEMRKTLLVF